jgi:hypothetical protein
VHELEELERRLAQRRVETPSELEALLANEFRELGCSGCEHSRQDVLAAYDFGSPRECEISDFRVLSLGVGLVLATYRTLEPGERRALRSSIWRRSQGRWRLVFHQGTLVP